MEIERKWLLKKLPQQEPKAKHFTEQFYISLDPEIRLRRSVPNGNYEPQIPYLITIKSNGSLSREEIETEVSEEFYNRARDLTNLETIEKHYLIYEVNGHEVDVSVVLSGKQFVYAEVEFNSEEEAIAYNFPWPDLIESEVTYNSDYKMKNVWRKLYNH